MKRSCKADVQHIRRLMEEHGDTQSDLARCMGISAVSMNRRLNSKMPFRFAELAFISARYNISIGDIRCGGGVSNG